MDLSLFTKINIEQGAGLGRLGSKTVRIVTAKKGTPRSITIGAPLVADANFHAGDRVDLYNFGPLFAIKKESAGCLRLRATNREAKTLTIGSTNAAIEVSSRTNRAREFDAWVDAGVIFFKPREEK